MKTINICFICDSGYVKPTAVAIESLKVNRSHDAIYNIFVIGTELSQKDKSLFTSLSCKNFVVENVTFSMPEKLKNVNISRHVPLSAMIKFYIPQIFKNLDKILYIDGDVLIQSDLVDLWNTDISEVYAGVVKDIRNAYDPDFLLQRLNFKYKAYFNSGVMLLNLNKCRKDSVTEQLVAYRINEYNFHMDQDALNMILGKNIKCIPFKYNMLTFCFVRLSVTELELMFGEKLPEQLIENYKTAAILHLGGKEKPWTHNFPYLTHEYKRYAKRIGWKIHLTKRTVMQYYLFGFIPFFSIESPK